MFRKKYPKCRKCKNNVSKSYDFCPYCGFQLRDTGNDEENWGILGKNDFLDENKSMTPPSMFNNGILDKMFGSAMKMLEKELQKNMREVNKRQEQSNQPNKNNIFPKTNLQIYINGKKVNLGELNNEKMLLRKKPLKKNNRKKIKKKVKEVKIPKKELKGFSKFPKTTPETNIRRLSDRIIYEISLPGVKSKKDISITKLENSIEVKAIGKVKRKKKAYYKAIKMSLPIINYKFSKESLVLELAAK